jgi:hypothetical protein
MTNRLPALGDRVRHRVTGFEGIVTSHATHLTGCDRLWIEPRVGADGKTIEGHWADIDMVEIVEPGVIEAVVYTRRAPGGADLPAPR